MIIELSKKATKKQVTTALAKLSRAMKNKKGKGNIAHHFGKLKADKDGVAFQKSVRNEWD